MAAYLVGTRGAALHAVGLGLAVSVAHTLGIALLALLVAGPGQLVAPDAAVRVAPLVAAVATIAIGAWMLVREMRRRGKADGRVAMGHTHAGVGHGRPAPHGRTITWRSLFALGLAGGIIPSTNALIILLLAIAAGRPTFGVVLVAAFGLGMAAVLISLGLGVVHARGWLGRLPAVAGGRFVGAHAVGAAGRFVDAAPIGASVVVLALGVWLAWQALLGSVAL
jgi:ABC-type nickel/cobalt efflux system permease component RcnA